MIGRSFGYFSARNNLPTSGTTRNISLLFKNRPLGHMKHIHTNPFTAEYCSEQRKSICFEHDLNAGRSKSSCIIIPSVYTYPKRQVKRLMLWYNMYIESCHRANWSFYSIFPNVSCAGSMGMLANARSFMWIKVQQYTSRAVQVRLFGHLHW